MMTGSYVARILRNKIDIWKNTFYLHFKIVIVLQWSHPFFWLHEWLQESESNRSVPPEDPKERKILRGPSLLTLLFGIYDRKSQMKEGP